MKKCLGMVAIVLAGALMAASCSNPDEDGTPPNDDAPTDNDTDSSASDPDGTEPDEDPTAAADPPVAEDGDEPVSDDSGRAEAFADLVRIEPPAECAAIPGVSDDDVRVGALLPLSGPRALSFSSALDGVKARIDAANANDELGGRTITLVEGDDASDAARNAEGARTLIEQDDVYGIIEISDQSDGSSDYLHENGVPVTGWHVGRAHWAQQENFFSFRLPAAAEPTVDHQNRTANVVAELGGQKIAIVGGGNESSAAFVNREIAAASEGGLEVVYSTTDVVSGNTEFTGIVQRIKDSGADSLLTGMDFLQNTALTQQLTDAGVELTVILFPGGYDSRVLGLPGIDQAVFGLEFIPFEADPAAFAPFAEAMGEDGLLNQITYIGWLSADMFIRGINEAGLECPSREAFVANLRLLDDWDGGGAFDPVDLNAAESWGPPFLCVYYVQVQDAAFVPLFDGEPRCGDPVTLS